MKRLIHLFMGIGGERAREAERTPAFEEQLRQAVEQLDGELALALSELSSQVSERNRLRAEVDRLKVQAGTLHEDAKRAVDQDVQQARDSLTRWAEVQQVIEGAGLEVERLSDACVSIETRVAELRKRLDETRRNANTLLARRSASRAQQRLADAVASGRDRKEDAPSPLRGAVAHGVIDVEAELRRLRGEANG